MTNDSRLAPIAIFAYKRTDHLARTLDALEACPEFALSPVFIFSDGPKDERSHDAIAAVRTLLRSRERHNFTIIESAVNRGLAASIIGGVTELCARFGRAIVIEDDLLLSSCALTWLNRGLDHFANDEAVWQVSAHQYDVAELREASQGVLLHLPTSWGWATWQRAWKNFDPSAEGWSTLKHDRSLRNRFDLGRTYPFSELLLRQMTGATDSWAIRWWWSMFKSDALTLFPPRTLVTNIGLDDTATHSSVGRLKQFVVSRQVHLEQVCPEMPQFNHAVPADDQFVYRALRRMWWATRLRARLRGSL